MALVDFRLRGNDGLVGFFVNPFKIEKFCQISLQREIYFRIISRYVTNF
jgi:hypothetical protein